jgi:dipeptidyl aminopeptidase/acylaminoacyl peptidase
LADVVGLPSQPTVLLWHGQQADARASVRPLVERIADHGLGVIAPDWNSSSGDGGRADLLNSVRFTRERVDDPDNVVLVGWSMGGVAAAGLTINAHRFGAAFAHTVCLSGAFMVADPITGSRPATQLRGAAKRTPFTLLHGVSDRVIPVAIADEFASALRREHWAVDVVELPADHGSIAGAVYDSAARRYCAASDAADLAVADEVAARIAGAGRPGR